MIQTQTGPAWRAGSPWVLRPFPTVATPSPVGIRRAVPDITSHGCGRASRVVTIGVAHLVSGAACAVHPTGDVGGIQQLPCSRRVAAGRVG